MDEVVLPLCTTSCLYQLCPYLAHETLSIVTHVLVISWLDYCNTFYMGLFLKIIWKLQLVQNVAANTVLGAPRVVHTTPLLHELPWLPICFWILFKYLLLPLNPIWNVSRYLRNCLTQMGLACPHLCQWKRSACYRPCVLWNSSWQVKYFLLWANPVEHSNTRGENCAEHFTIRTKIFVNVFYFELYIIKHISVWAETGLIHSKSNSFESILIKSIWIWILKHPIT